MSWSARPLVTSAAALLLVAGCSETVEGSASSVSTAPGSTASEPPAPAGSGPERELVATVDLTPYVTPGYFPRLIEPDGAGGAFVLLSGRDPYGTELVHLTPDGSGGLTGGAAVPIARATAIDTMDRLPDGTLALGGAFDNEAGYRRTGVAFVDPATGTGPLREYVDELTLSGPPFTAVSPDGTTYYALTPGTATDRNRLLAVDVASGQVTNGIDVGLGQDPPVALAITPDGTQLIAVFELYSEDGFQVAVRRFDTDLEEDGSSVSVGEPADIGFGALGVTPDGTAVLLVGEEPIEVHTLPQESDEATQQAFVEAVGSTLTVDVVPDAAGTTVTVAEDHLAVTVDLTSGATGAEVSICENGLGADALVPGDRGSVLVLGTCNDAVGSQIPYVWILGPPT